MKEIMLDGKDEIILESNFAVLERIQDCPSGKPLSTLFAEMSQGNIEVNDIKHVIKCCVVSLNDELIKNKDEYAESLIERHGLQQMHQMCYLMLSHAMIGEKKSSKITTEERLEALNQTFLNLKFKSLKKALFLWGTMLILSTSAACLITSYTMKLIA